MEKRIVRTRNQILTHFHQQINILQNANLQLEQKIRQRTDYLHKQIGSIHNNEGLIKSIKQKQQQMQKDLSQRLMKDQVRIQQQKQMNEIVKNYQKRIMDLRNALVNKQAQIAYQTYQPDKQTIPTIQNIRLVSKESFEKRTIKKALQQLKKLKAEIQALQYYVINMKIGKKSKMKIPIDLSISQIAQVTEAIKNKLQNTHKDKLLMKVYNLLQGQLQREAQLQYELQQLKIEFKQNFKLHLHYVHKYQGHNKRNAKQQREINFLSELQRAEDQQNNNKLFKKFDLNLQVHKEKIGRKRVSKQKSWRADKENVS